MSARPSPLRALALVALLLPGLILSGAHLCLCVGELLGLGTPCATMAEADCCGTGRSEETSAQDAPDCGVCCITIDVAEPVETAPAPDTASADLPLSTAPPRVLVALLPEPPQARAPAPRAPPPARLPGRAPTPLRI